MNPDLNTKCNEYFTIQKTLKLLRKQQKELKDKLVNLESDIQDFMTNNDMESLVLESGQIMLYDQKKNETLKKDTIVENLTKKLNNQSKAEEITEYILTNKKFSTERKIKAVIKK